MVTSQELLENWRECYGDRHWFPDFLELIGAQQIDNAVAFKHRDALKLNFIDENSLYEVR